VGSASITFRTDQLLKRRLRNTPAENAVIILGLSFFHGASRIRGEFATFSIR